MKGTRTRVGSPAYEFRGWTAQEDFILRMLVGTTSYRQIALRLGRSYSATREHASQLGLSQREARKKPEKADPMIYHRHLTAQEKENLLRTPEEDLSEFLPECTEEPVEVTSSIGAGSLNRLDKGQWRY